MGDPKRQRKKFETPRHPWRADVLGEELKLLGLFGLRNKRELWKHETQLTKYRDIARSLLAMPPEKRSKLESELLTKLFNLGLIEEEASIENVLDLVVQDILERRLQTQVSRLGLAKSLYQSRQLITHGHISMVDRKITSPSYLVKRGTESQINFSTDSPLSEAEHPIRKALSVVSSTQGNEVKNKGE
jgi:small subunit ribosomal protein S4